MNDGANSTVTQGWMKRQLVANPKWHVFMAEVEKNAWKITLLTRLLPFPFGLVNGLFAVRTHSRGRSPCCAARAREKSEEECVA